MAKRAIKGVTKQPAPSVREMLESGSDTSTDVDRKRVLDFADQLAEASQLNSNCEYSFERMAYRVNVSLTIPEHVVEDVQNASTTDIARAVALTLGMAGTEALIDLLTRRGK